MIAMIILLSPPTKYVLFIPVFLVCLILMTSVSLSFRFLFNSLFNFICYSYTFERILLHFFSISISMAFLLHSFLKHIHMMKYYAIMLIKFYGLAKNISFHNRHTLMITERRSLCIERFELIFCCYSFTSFPVVDFFLHLYS